MCDRGRGFGYGRMPDRGRACGDGRMPDRGCACGYGRMPDRGRGFGYARMPDRGRACGDGRMPDRGCACGYGRMPDRGRGFGYARMPDRGRGGDCESDKNLVDFGAVRRELTVKDMNDVTASMKAMTQPLGGPGMTKCRKGHDLAPFNPTQLAPGVNVIWCDVCFRRQTGPALSACASCRTCDFDVCQSCRSKFGACPPPVKCPKGHVLAARSIPGWCCDICSGRHEGDGSFSQACTDCKYDICEKCFTSVASKQWNK